MKIKLALLCRSEEYLGGGSEVDVLKKANSDAPFPSHDPIINLTFSIIDHNWTKGFTSSRINGVAPEPSSLSTLVLRFTSTCSWVISDSNSSFLFNSIFWNSSFLSSSTTRWTGPMVSGSLKGLSRFNLSIPTPRGLSRMSVGVLV